jgi:hypothetical protein
MTNFKRYLATVAIVGAAIVAIGAIVIRGNLTPEELARIMQHRLADVV